MSTAAGQGNLIPIWSRYRLSQAGWVSVGVGAILLTLFLANWAAYRSQPQRVAWADYMQWPQYFAATVLWLIICTMTYWLVRMWNEELPTDNVELEAAWQAGIKSLQNRGQTLQQMPLFVIVGAGDRQHQQQLLEQSGQRMLDPILPAEPNAPLHWAFTDRGAWLFVNSAGTYSKLAKSPFMRSDTSAAAWSSWPNLRPSTPFQQVEANDQNTNGTRSSPVSSSHGQPTQPVDTETRPEIEPPTGKGYSFNSVTNGASADREIAVALLSEPALLVGSQLEQATIQKLDDLEVLVECVHQQEAVAAVSTGDPDVSDATAPEPFWQTELAFQSASQPTALSSTEIAQEQHKLRELCRRLRNERGSIAPANGVVYITPCEQLMSGCVRASELGLAIRSDLQIIQDAWRLQTPTTILVEGFEGVPGGMELIRCGGPEQALADGVGATYPIRYQTEKQLVDYHCQLAVGQIENRIYRQLSSAAALSQVGNLQLFQLLITCRSRLLPALQSFTCGAIGLTHPAHEEAEPVLFAGLHFMATGQKATHQAWVKAAFAEVLNAQNYLRWTKSRLRSDRRHQLIISILKAICFLLIVTMAAALWWVR